jgi:hypothetical protein
MVKNKLVFENRLPFPTWRVAVLGSYFPPEKVILNFICCVWENKTMFCEY